MIEISYSTFFYIYILISIMDSIAVITLIGEDYEKYTVNRLALAIIVFITGFFWFPRYIISTLYTIFARRRK